MHRSKPLHLIVGACEQGRRQNPMAVDAGCGLERAIARYY